MISGSSKNTTPSFPLWAYLIIAEKAGSFHHRYRGSSKYTGITAPSYMHRNLLLRDFLSPVVPANSNTTDYAYTFFSSVELNHVATILSIPRSTVVYEMIHEAAPRLNSAQNKIRKV